MHNFVGRVQTPHASKTFLQLNIYHQDPINHLPALRRAALATGSVLCRVTHDESQFWCTPPNDAPPSIVRHEPSPLRLPSPSLSAANSAANSDSDGTYYLLRPTPYAFPCSSHCPDLLFYLPSYFHSFYFPSFYPNPQPI